MSTESAKYRATETTYFALSELLRVFFYFPGATRLAKLGACPWLSYFAPLARGTFRVGARMNIRAVGAAGTCPGEHIPHGWRCEE